MTKQRKSRPVPLPPAADPKPRQADPSGAGTFAPETVRQPLQVDSSGLWALAERAQNLRAAAAFPPLSGEVRQVVRVIPPEVTAALALVATNAWRAMLKTVEPDTGQPREEMRRVHRHLEGIFNALEELGLKTVDPTGRPYDPGMALKVIGFEETPGLAREEIKETIKPSITWHERLVQMGEVIVGTPPRKAEAGGGE